MGALAGPLGLAGSGAAGSGFAAPQQANIVNPTNANQLGGAYTGVQNSLQSQQQLLQALQQQGGLQAQNQALQGYSNLANGTGPNPAMAQLAQTTGQNVAATGALQAGQRGAASNVGLIARQAVQQGAATQQQAVGQAATLGAQQQLAGLQGMAGQANTMAANQVGQTNANTAAQQATQANLLNAQAAANTANVGMQSNINQGNTALALQSMQQGESAMGGAAQGGGSALMSMMAGGGSVKPMKMADGGSAFSSGPSSEFGQFLSSVNGGGGISGGNYVAPNSVMQSATPQQPTKKGQPISQDDSDDDTQGAAKGGMVDVVLSPGEKVVKPKDVKKVAEGGELKAATVPGKAKVAGDNYKNDTFKTKLPPGSVVVKRTRANNDPKGFVRDVLAKRGRK